MTGPGPDPVAELLAAAYADGTLTPRAVAEAVWLIDRLFPASAGGAEPTGRPDPGPASPVPPVPAGDDVSADPPPLSPRVVPPPPVAPPPEPRPGVAVRPATSETGRLQHRPAARPALVGATAIGRALRPLRRPVRAPGPGRLDERTTAHRSAEAGTLVPVSVPADEDWLELAVVVDTGVSMALWKPTLTELVRTLRGHPAFRDVRIWSVDGDSTRPRLRTGLQGGQTGGDRSSAELTDPTGRRLILVVTDGTGRLWRTEAAAAAVLDWAARSPLAFVNVLPERLWHRSALPAVPVAAYPAPPLSGMLAIRPLRPGRPGGTPGQRLVPVVELDAAAIGRWAATVAGTRSGPGRLAAAALPGRPAPGPVEPPATSAVELVKRFRLTAAPAAFELATFLAAAPLTVPVMRLVQRNLVPRSGPADLAEVFLSGLLVAAPGSVGDDPDRIVYDLAVGAPGEPTVREELLANLPRADAFRVLDLLSHSTGGEAETFGGSLDFRSLLPDRAGGPTAPPESRPFAEVVVAVLNGLGGGYQDLADDIAAAPSEPARGRSAAPVSGRPVVAALSVTGQVLVGYRDGGLRVFDPTGAVTVRALSLRPQVPAVAVAALTLGERDVWAAVWSDGVLQVWDLPTGARLTPPPSLRRPVTAAVLGSHRGRAVAVTSDPAGLLQVSALDSPEDPPQTVAVAEPARTLHLSTNRVLAVGVDGGLREYPLPDSPGVQRHALLIGIGHYEEGADLPDLPFAGERIRAVAAALRRLGYTCFIPERSELMTAAGIDHVITQAVDRLGPGDSLIVHLLGHARIAGDGSLRLIGADGSDHMSAASPRWRKLIADESRSPHTLFLSDLCLAGPSRLPLRSSFISGIPELASAYGEDAFDGRFSRAVAGILHRIADGDLDLDPAMPYVPLTTVARMLRQWGLEIYSVMTDTRVEAPFFPNRRPSRQPGGAHPAPDPALDANHFVRSASGWREPGFFIGRRAELEQLDDWLNGQEPIGSVLVNGPLGSGKSALLVQVVRANFPTLRDAATGAARTPAPGTGPAMVHARGRTVSEIAVRLGRQLGHPVDGPRPLLDALAARIAPAAVILDALDEADHPVELQEFLLSLMSIHLADGRPACRVLISTRPSASFDPLRRAVDRLVDLTAATPADLHAYLNLLAAELMTGYEEPEISEWIRTLPFRGDEFLLARWFVESLGGVLPPASYRPPVTLADMLELSLTSRAASGRTLLAILANARGDGMPRATLRRALSVLEPGSPFTDPLTDSYVQISPDGNYLPSHQALTDHLRRDITAANLFSALLPRTGGLSTGPVRWDIAEPYLLRYAMDHALDAGRADELWLDLDFVVRADRRAVTAGDPAQLRSADARAIAIACRSVDDWSHLSVTQRAEALRVALGTTLEDSGVSRQLHRLAVAPELGPSVNPAVTLAPAGAVTQAVSVRGGPSATVSIRTDGRLRLHSPDGDVDFTVTPLDQPAHLAATARMVVTVDHDGTLRAWDTGSIRQLLTIRTGTEPIEVVAAAEIGGVPSALTVAADWTAKLWDLNTGRLSATFAASPRSETNTGLRILGVHGAWNANQSSTVLTERWSSALRAAHPGLTAELLVPYLGDLLRGAADEPEPAQRPVTIGASQPLADMAEEIATAMRQPSSVTEPLRRMTSFLAERFGTVTSRAISSMLTELTRYLSRPDVRRAVRRRLTDELRRYRPNVVIAHSIGTVMAYEALWEASDVPVELFVTLGSPLGLSSVMSALDPAPVDGRGARPPGVRSWANLAEAGDVIAVPRNLSRLFDGIDRDDEVHLPGLDFHRVSAYLSTPQLGTLLTIRQDR
ncbi:SAV_2336 N-terminal domain-related protein [Actinoplanes sp. URMC 104]|uniref:SAV_2336 N-terminal domain-related protein n=1 Tax=Actinoplanes sp. URMC 104 TaxID=3423409 RepID=UPI003F1BA7E1